MRVQNMIQTDLEISLQFVGKRVSVVAIDIVAKRGTQTMSKTRKQSHKYRLYNNPKIHSGFS